jgi:drug/metabolite transporter (DMT)-like permease
MTDVMLIAMATIWGVNYSVIKFGVRTFSPLVFNGVRIPIAALLQLGGSRYQHNPALGWGDRARLIALGMIGNGLYQVLFIIGVSRTRVATAALVMAATPALIAILGHLHGSERSAERSWGGIVLQLIGVGSVAFGASGGRAGTDSLLGVVLVLGGSMSWAVYSIAIRPYANRIPELQLGGYTMLGGALVAVAAAFRLFPAVEWGNLPLRAWLAVAYSAVAALVVAYLFWYRGVRAIGPTRTSMYGNLQPLIAMAVAWLALHEQPTVWQLTGATLIMSGLVLARTGAAAPGNPD